jgi:hypothetical protein
LKKLYGAAGIADSVNFQLHAFVGFSKPSPGDPGGYLCPDEEYSCPSTQWILCAMGATNTTTEEKISFLTCFDTLQDLSPSKTTLQKKAETCAATAKLDYSTIAKCHYGHLNTTLLARAHTSTVERFPAKRFPKGVGVPDLQVNGVEIKNYTDYNSILHALCATGIKAGACKQTRIVV